MSIRHKSVAAGIFGLAGTLKAMTAAQVATLLLVAALLLFPALAIPFMGIRGADAAAAPQEQTETGMAEPVRSDVIENPLPLAAIDTTEPAAHGELLTLPSYGEGGPVSVVEFVRRAQVECEDLEGFSRRYAHIIAAQRALLDAQVAVSLQQQEQQPGETGIVTLPTMQGHASALSAETQHVYQMQAAIAQGKEALGLTLANWLDWEKAFEAPAQRRQIVGSLQACLDNIGNPEIACSPQDVGVLVNAFRHAEAPLWSASSSTDFCEARTAHWRQTTEERLASNGLQFSPYYQYVGSGCYYQGDVSMLTGPSGASASIVFHNFQGSYLNSETCTVRIGLLAGTQGQQNALSLTLRTHSTGAVYGQESSTVSTTGHIIAGNGMTGYGYSSDFHFGSEIFPHVNSVLTTYMGGSLAPNRTNSGTFESTTTAVVNTLDGYPANGYMNVISLDVTGGVTHSAATPVMVGATRMVVTVTALGAVVLGLL